MCEYGILSKFVTLELSTSEKIIFAYILERWRAYNAYKDNNCAIPVSQSDLRKALDTESKSHVSKVLQQLIDKNYIMCVKKGCGRTPSKYKVIDKRFVPKKPQK